jgi:hypothetical protein
MQIKTQTPLRLFAMKKPACPTIVDIEASGFSSFSYPIEIGVITFNGERYCALIKPEVEWTHWCESAAKIHGISQALIKARGKSARQVCEELNVFLQGSVAYSDAWACDSPWLTQLFFAAKINPQFHLSPIENIATEEQLLLWDKAKITLQQKLNIQRHRASGDAYLIQQTYIETNRLLITEQALAEPLNAALALSIAKG